MLENPFESPETQTPAATSFSQAPEVGMPLLVTRSLFGGLLMGLANLVPGISGGTMLLAAGIYPPFIDSLSKVTRFKFDIRSLVVLLSLIHI